MPLANIAAARDAIFGAVKAAVDASAYPTLAVYYSDVVKDGASSGEPYMVVYADHTSESQRTMGGLGDRRFTVSGLVMAQIFTPFGDGHVLADAISGVVKGAFRGVNTNLPGVWFRNSRVIDVGQEGSWLQTNVTAEFEYDEIA
jgi:hypothetical protein